MSDKHRDRITEACAILRAAERPVRILRSISWPPEVAVTFFAKGAREMPEIDYTPIDPSPVTEGVEKARRLAVGSSPAHAWLQRVAAAISTAARMIAAVGTPDFHRYSIELYKSPTEPMLDEVTQPLALARQIDETLAAFARDPDKAKSEISGGEKMMTADELGIRMRPILLRFFGDHSPHIDIVDNLSANALAGSQYIRLRRGAKFSERDLQQLVQHEAFIHIGTSLNGREQSMLPILGAGHPGTTRTQEGLAVFAEMISGSMDPERMRRLANRVIAIQMAIEGADFLDIYRFFLERGNEPQQAFESARRVVRGGVLSGGAPFTKDVVYLEGLLRVHNFLRATVQFGRLDCLHLLFCGKLDVEDLPAMVMLAENGLCKFPKFLPPWASDSGFLISYLAYSSFLNRVNLDRVRLHYSNLLANVPKLDIPVPSS
ncbi:MAG: flavohemoglobin expression-modulating QEGLA motif protein [Proteobacteria bacterium]|nr:flavohemoglobin expression-modulating QEGLA motif protein [Pseudomonadota bacterium]MDA1022066.1 flavohemoglobin expression-modulating QEGLA motif protein [Pseudomonadota bacterium]